MARRLGGKVKPLNILGTSCVNWDFLCHRNTINSEYCTRGVTRRDKRSSNLRGEWLLLDALLRCDRVQLR